MSCSESLWCTERVGKATCEPPALRVGFLEVPVEVCWVDIDALYLRVMTGYRQLDDTTIMFQARRHGAPTSRDHVYCIVLRTHSVIRSWSLFEHGQATMPAVGSLQPTGQHRDSE